MEDFRFVGILDDSYIEVVVVLVEVVLKERGRV